MAGNAAIIEDQLIEARVAQVRENRETGYESTFVPGDAEVAATGPMTSVSNEGDTVMIISTLDGEPRPIPSLMLAKTLKKKIPGTNKRAFEMVDPTTGIATGPVPKYEPGNIPCWFNPKSEQWAVLSEIPGLRGFQCASEHLASEFDAEMHAKNRHTRRYGVAKDYLERKEREDDRAIRREEIKAMQALAKAAAQKAG